MTQSDGEWWRGQLALATGWEEAGGDAVALGALLVELPLMVSGDPVMMDGVWPAMALAVAPLSSFFRAVQGGSRFFAENIFGAGGSGEWLDVEGLAMERELFLSRIPPSHAMVGEQEWLARRQRKSAMRTRNPANYAQAGLGEIVDLDDMRGSKAMMLGRFAGPQASGKEGAKAFDAAIERAFRALGAACFFSIKRSGWVKVDGWVPEGPLARPWPSTRAQWDELALSVSERLSLAEAAGAAHAAGKRSGL